MWTWIAPHLVGVAGAALLAALWAGLEIRSASGRPRGCGGCASQDSCEPEEGETWKR